MCLLEDHRIGECFGWEGTFRAHLAHTPPCSKQGHLQPDQVAQSPIQPDLKCFQGCGISHLSGQPVPVFHQPHCKNFFLKMNLALGVDRMIYKVFGVFFSLKKNVLKSKCWMACEPKLDQCLMAHWIIETRRILIHLISFSLLLIFLLLKKSNFVGHFLFYL